MEDSKHGIISRCHYERWCQTCWFFYAPLDNNWPSGRRRSCKWENLWVLQHPVLYYYTPDGTKEPVILPEGGAMATLPLKALSRGQHKAWSDPPLGAIY